MSAGPAGSSSGGSSSSGSNTSISSKLTSTEINQDDHSPLWAYVSILEQGVDGGGNRTWSCNFCQRVVRSSYSRVRAHLLKIPYVGIAGCPEVRVEHLIELKKVYEDADHRINSVKPKIVPLPPSASGSGLKRKKLGPLAKAFNIEDREHLNGEIARMFYSAGLPFHLARNPHYVNSYSFAASYNIGGFVPPGYNVIRTTLLQKERAHIETLLKPIKSMWKSKGVSIVSDGWTDSQRRPLINFMATSEGNPIFLKAYDGSKEYKDKHYLAGLMKSVIDDVGPTNVVQVITDNVAVCKAAGMLIEVDYPEIFWTPCVVHTLNLALKNICAPRNSLENENAYNELNWITQVADDVSFVRNFIMNHSMRLAIFNEFVTLKLLAIAQTRFASVIVMLKRFKLIKHALQTMVISEQWNSYSYREKEQDMQKAATVKDFILSDSWWAKIEYILAFTEPIYGMLRLCDTDRPTLHLVYDMWDIMIQKVKAAIYNHEGKQENDSSSFYEVVLSILNDRWSKSSTPLHCLAHSLNPRYYIDEWLSEAPNRIAPHEDVEISRQRNKCLKRFFPDNETRRQVSNEFACFSSMSDEFADHESVDDREVLDPKSWWVNHGSSAKLLQQIALKLLVQPCSSSCCERNWSTYSFINSLKRNKLHPKRAEDLVYIHTNLRLLSRKSEAYKKGASKMWDVGGDAWSPFEGGAGVLEVADLSLDEPDLESVLFTDDGIVDELSTQ